MTTNRNLTYNLILTLILIFALVVAAFAVNTDFVFGATKYPDITITIDGQPLITDVAPIIMQGRTLLPAKVLVEKLGGSAEWNQEKKEVDIVQGDIKIKLTINSKVAIVNNENKQLEVPATIISGRTLIPARFVSEQLGCDVAFDFNDVRRDIIITSKKSELPVPSETPVPVANLIQILEVKNYHYKDGKYRTEIVGAGNISANSNMSMISPNRYVMDFKNTVLKSEIPNITVEMDPLITIRVAQFDSSTVRVVWDLTSKVVPSISMAYEKKNIFVDFVLTGKEITTGSALNEGGPPYSEPFTVVIDMGHGGSDPGATWKENDQIVLMEKDYNLPIGLRLNEKLKAAGINTYLTRAEDVSVALVARPEIANELRAGLLVSIHNNSLERLNIRGSEVFYNSKENEYEYGIYSKDLAYNVGNNLKNDFSEFGIPLNSVRSNPALAVLRISSMPAIIVEGGYISNVADRNIMMTRTEEYIEKYATAVANAIIDAVRNRENIW